MRMRVSPESGGAHAEVKTVSVNLVADAKADTEATTTMKTIMKAAERIDGVSAREMRASMMGHDAVLVATMTTRACHLRRASEVEDLIAVILKLHLDAARETIAIATAADQRYDARAKRSHRMTEKHSAGRPLSR
jgi:hypothetical protein